MAASYPSAAISVTFHFEGSPDYDVTHPSWEGELPAAGSIVLNHPRTHRWKVREHVWTLAVDRQERTIGRAVSVYLQQE